MNSSKDLIDKLCELPIGPVRVLLWGADGVARPLMVDRVYGYKGEVLIELNEKENENGNEG